MYQVTIPIVEGNPNSITTAVNNLNYPYQIDIQDYLAVPTFSSLYSTDELYARYNAESLKQQFGDELLSRYLPSKFRVDSTSNTYTAVYGKGYGTDKEEYQVTFNSGGYDANGLPTSASVSAIEEFATEEGGRWRAITAGNDYFTRLNSQAFSTELNLVGKPTGGVYSWHGWNPIKYMKDENVWTVVYR